MTPKQFYDWQTNGGTDDVMKFINILEQVDVPWCAIGGIAVNYWSRQPMVTQDVDLVVATEVIERVIILLKEAGFNAERFPWSVNFQGNSIVSIQISTEPFYRDYPS